MSTRTFRRLLKEAIQRDTVEFVAENSWNYAGHKKGKPLKIKNKRTIG